MLVDQHNHNILLLDLDLEIPRLKNCLLKLGLRLCGLGGGSDSIVS